MTTYRTRPVEVQAVQWWKRGDSPHVVMSDQVPAYVMCNATGEEAAWFIGDHQWTPIMYGDWIITHPNGTVEHVPQQDFPTRFEPPDKQEKSR